MVTFPPLKLLRNLATFRPNFIANLDAHPDRPNKEMPSDTYLVLSKKNIDNKFRHVIDIYSLECVWSNYYPNRLLNIGS